MTETQMHDAINSAFQAARSATKNYLVKHGENDACGFAWVNVSPATSKVAKMLKKSFGAEPSYRGGIDVWNPSASYTQSITAKEEGAIAFVDIMRQKFPEVTFSACSRMD